MAVIFMDGFEIDFADNTSGLWDVFAENTAANGDLQYVSTHPRTGSGCLRIQVSSSGATRYISKTLPSAHTELYIQFGLYFASTQALLASDGTTVALLRLVSTTGVAQITLGLNESTRTLEVKLGRQDGTLLGNGSTGLAADAMHLIELRVVISDTVGVIQARLNGNLEIDLSALDTNNAGGGDIKVVELGVSPGSISSDGGTIDAFFDDFIVADAWPNGAGIERLDPSADGNYSQWTSTGGATDYTQVDDVASYGEATDGATTALSHQTVGERTSVQLDNTTIVGTVLGVMLLSNVKNSAAGADQMAQFVRLGGTDYDQTTFTPATTFGWRMDTLSVSPATAVAFTTAEIDGMELGWVVK